MGGGRVKGEISEEEGGGWGPTSGPNYRTESVTPVCSGIIRIVFTRKFKTSLRQVVRFKIKNLLMEFFQQSS